MDRPAWQTEELDEEWPEEDTNGTQRSAASATSSISLTQAIGSLDITDQLHQRSRNGSVSSALGGSQNGTVAKGTFVVREDQAPPLLPKTPAKSKGAGFAGMFNPLAIEKMFDPPTPPASTSALPREASPPGPTSAVLRPSPGPSPLTQSHLPVPSDIPAVNIIPSNSNSINYGDLAPPTVPGTMDMRHMPSTEFTFSAPRLHTPNSFTQGAAALAESTPGPSKPTNLHPRQIPGTPHAQVNINREVPTTDQRLRLFQFQYDTYTREQLSALVDSIAVGSPSSTHFSPNGSNPAAGATFALSRVTEGSDESKQGSINRMRAAKRVKLSLSSPGNEDAAGTMRTADSYGEGAGAGAHIARPRQQIPQKELLQVQQPQSADQSRSRRDYVSESRNLMQQIRSTRDFSTVSTVLSAMENSPPISRTSSAGTIGPPPDVPIPPVPGATGLDGAANADTNPFGSKRPVSSLAYRQKAANLMAQIRMGTERMFSGATTTDQSYDTETPTAPPAPASHASATDALLSTHAQSVTSAGRSSSASTIPGFVFTSRNPPRQVSAQSQDTAVASGSESKGKAQSPRKRTRVSTDPDDVVTMPGSQPRSRVPSTSTNGISPSPTLSSFPLPPSLKGHYAQAEALAELPPPPPSRPAGYPSDTLRNRAGQDVNRYVSSSTTASGTSTGTGTTGMTSVGSFVKHAGPPITVEKVKVPATMTQIRPEDVGALPHRVGSMVFDSQQGIWHHARPDVQRDWADVSGIGDASSDDPFRDIESLRDEASIAPHARNSRSRTGGPAQDMVYPVEQDDTREIVQNIGQLTMVQEGDSRFTIDPNSFSIEDADAMSVVTSIVNTRGNDTDGTTDSEDENDFLEMTGSSSTARLEQHEADESSEVQPIDWRAGVDGSSFTTEALPAIHGIPLPPTRDIPVIPPTPVLRPALRTASVTPMSALKGGPRVSYTTPLSNVISGHRRSVSFSDGKKEGQIRGLMRDDGTMTTIEDSDWDAEDRSLSALQTGDRSTFVPSARSKRIADMLAMDDDESAFVDDTPSKSGSANSNSHSRSQSQNGSMRGSKSQDGGSISRRSLSRSNASVLGEASRKGHATFLTEWSFEVAHDRLVTVITDVQPFKPYWEELDAIALDDKHLDGVARLKEFLPRLDALSLNQNQLTYLTGVPGTVRTLSVSQNCLTSVTSFQHLLNLENLDISRNEIDSLQHLACLRHLRELRADGNSINTIDGLQGLDSLVKLSLQGNKIRTLDCSTYRWPRLEMLNLSDNRLESLSHLESVPALVVLNLDHNRISTLDTNGTLPKLRILRLSSNKLQRISGAPFPNLRTLYADNNAITGLDKVSKLSKLENLSLRNQSGKGLKLNIKDVRDVKRLYLSGNPLDGTFLQDACYNLIYMEVAACRLTILPPNFSALAPNLRVLNLNYNFISDLQPLEGLSRLKKLTLIGSRLVTSRALIKCVKGMPDAEMLDFRMNPCTLGWYLPLLVRDAPGALQPSEGKDARQIADERSGGTAWRDLDAKFRKDLPDEAYVGRLVYRGLIMEACPGIKLVDGVPITAKERDKAVRLLESILAKRAQAAKVASLGA